MKGRALTRQRILLVEDDRSVGEILALFLSDAYEVKLAATGADALVSLRHEPVAAVVLDYRLPDRTGLEVLTEARSIQPGVPVIMMTGYGSEWLCASAFKLGVRDYLPKPVSPLDLLSSVRRVISESLEVGGPSESAAPEGPGMAAARKLPGWKDLLILKATKLIEQRYWDQLSLHELARQVGMSRSRLSHRFKEVMGVSFRDYLITVRLERAKHLLAAGYTSITEVAQMVGFGDLPRFDKLFKRYSGVTPSVYRVRATRGRRETGSDAPAWPSAPGGGAS